MLTSTATAYADAILYYLRPTPENPNGRVIQAIKAMREAAPWGLKEAKDYIDDVRAYGRRHQFICSTLYPMPEPLTPPMESAPWRVKQEQTERKFKAERQNEVKASPYAAEVQAIVNLKALINSQAFDGPALDHLYDALGIAQRDLGHKMVNDALDGLV